MARIVLVAVFLFSEIAPVPGAPPALRDGGEQASPTVAQALEKELAGDNAGRQSLLRERLVAAPDDPAAHWHLGEIRGEDRWLPYDRVADDGNRWRELYRYAEERARRKNNIEDQLFLADGARSHGLFDQERAHLTQVVTLDPAHIEAHQRLGDIFTEGTWIRRETFNRVIESDRVWKERLARHEKEAEQFAARMRQFSPAGQEKLNNQWNVWGDPEKLPALERATGDKGDSFQSSYVSWLGRLPCFEASRALVRQSLFSEYESIRLQATDELKRRPLEDYMRELVASVTAVRDSTDPVLDRRSNSHIASVVWETMDAVVETQWTLRNPINVTLTPILPPRRGVPLARGYNLPRIDRHEAAGRAASELWQTIQQMQAAEDSARNGRALRTIGRIAGKSFTSPREVWGWWEGVDDVVQVQQRVSRNYEDNWYIDTRRRRVQTSPWPVVTLSDARIWNPVSCLAAGTPIVTETGVRPIESVEIGDRVLAQDIETGELAFKPVFARTTREKAKLYRLKTASEEIVCSQGHPFWVNTIGWVQARALKPGMPLHTPSGCCELTSTEPAGEGTVYNVIVADAHSYFVGKSQPFLSHDPTARRATNALMPGLQPTWADAPASTERPVTLK